MLCTNSLWLSDIDEVIRVITPELAALTGKTVMVTGATGLIGSSVIDILCRYNDTHKGRIRILAAGRQPERMKARFRGQANRSDLRFVVYDASRSDNAFTDHADYIIHGASNAFPSLIVKEPVETMMSNILGMKCLLDYAKEQGTRRVLFISSSEIYGKKEETEPYGEEQYGYIDLLKPRNAYSVAKRAAETLCISYADEYGVDSVIVRPGHIYGPTASINDNRVSSAWAYAVARGEDIIMKSDGTQVRSYCYCLDCASAILKVLLKGESGHAYNISNPDSVISIKEMAEILATSAGVQVKMELPTEEERKGFNPMSNSSLDSTSLIGLGWGGCFDAKTGFGHTVSVLKTMV